MTIVGLDDTDSRDRGMCTTYVAAVLGEQLAERGMDVRRSLLVRCNPAVEHKTRGNAAVALHVSGDPGVAFTVARETVEELAETADPDTNPGVVVAHGDPGSVPADVAAFSREAVRDRHGIDDAVELAERHGYRAASWGTGRGRIGALAAVGAWAAGDGPAGSDGSSPSGDSSTSGGSGTNGGSETNSGSETNGGPAAGDRPSPTDDWTYERIAYREPDRWGTARTVDNASVVAAAEAHYPAVWDTLDRTADEVVCVPHTPGPVLFGIRGDDRAAVEAVADAIDAEPIERAVTFWTNQGTDAHLRDGDLGSLADGRAYRVDGTVASAPETRAGGHVFFDLGASGSAEHRDPVETGADGSDAAGGSEAGAGGSGAGVDECETSTGDASPAATVQCVAFEPTKRFRDRVRALRPGDDLTACGEVTDGTLKLEKFAVRDLVRTGTATPTCEDCGRTMESAGADQGYRCRDCGTAAPGPVRQAIERDLEPGWYEVPPVARRHVARPLVRGGFDAPTHPER